MPTTFTTGPDLARLVADLHSVLAEHGALDRLSLRLTTSALELDADEVLVERVFLDSREVVATPVKIADLVGTELLHDATSVPLNDPALTRHIRAATGSSCLTRYVINEKKEKECIQVYE